MANLERQRVRFTGDRTGMEAISIKGVGIVEVGDVIEVSAEEGTAWTTPVPMRDGKEGSDWTKVGGVYDSDEGRVGRRMMKQAEKHAPDADIALGVEVNTEPAHEVIPDFGTVEEYAEVALAEPEDDAPEKKTVRGKKSE